MKLIVKLKGRFEQSSVVTQFLILVFTTIAGLTMTSIMSSIILIMKFGTESLMIVRESPEWMKNMQFFQTIGVFIFPAIICAWLFSDNYKSYLHIDTAFQGSIIGLVMLSILVIIPFLNGIYVFNQQMVFPKCLNGLEAWMKNYEKLSQNVIERMLYVYRWQDLVSNILIVCIFTAIGEEFIFRGILQNLLNRFIKNQYLVIWIVAILFSIVHLQFYGFLSRMLLGAYLGYLLYYTGNIWISILAHFMNNFLGVINSYIFQDNPKMVERINNIGSGTTWWLSIVSLTLFFILFYIIKDCVSSNHPNCFD
ncbi:CPBP family intramembrane glutamic endopeptidase [Candidatus Azobacteroides pseudotrichonymphae]|uniref:Protease n=1 Tax=Azobacteroides pseudotrichonymphae genomovar. CFP2 TaxID=511995 RepID=B6YS37_AZOPC|nr:CPBP family intramembrane glutamic endopeptidase [Candidatus Azobacteroides pseudotrichonymphae]BAG84009.1 putative protease [Candidatus Azobacteroides pseudotrichonymphae genomovar. CFP2]